MSRHRRRTKVAVTPLPDRKCRRAAAAAGQKMQACRWTENAGVLLPVKRAQLLALVFDCSNNNKNFAWCIMNIMVNLMVHNELNGTFLKISPLKTQQNKSVQLARYKT
jgi:hypothetical protein